MVTFKQGREHLYAHWNSNNRGKNDRLNSLLNPPEAESLWNFILVNESKNDSRNLYDFLIATEMIVSFVGISIRRPAYVKNEN